MARWLGGEGAGALTDEAGRGEPLDPWAGPEPPLTAAPPPADPVPARPAARRFRPRHALAGLVAAGTVAIVSLAAGALSWLWLPLAQHAPPSLLWVLRGLPLPALWLLWAVAAETQYKVMVDADSITFRRTLGPTVRAPWGTITDYYLDCGRPPWQAPSVAPHANPDHGRQAMSLTGKAVTNRAAGASFVLVTDPDRTQPTYIVESSRGRFRFDHGLEDVAQLREIVVQHAAQACRRRWEERPAFRCPRCGSVFAFRVAPRPAPLDDTLWVTAAAPPSCPACGTPAPELATLVARHGVAEPVPMPVEAPTASDQAQDSVVPAGSP